MDCYCKDGYVRQSNETGSPCINLKIARGHQILFNVAKTKNTKNAVHHVLRHVMILLILCQKSQKYVQQYVNLVVSAKKDIIVLLMVNVLDEKNAVQEIMKNIQTVVLHVLKLVMMFQNSAPINAFRVVSVYRMITFARTKTVAVLV